MLACDQFYAQLKQAGFHFFTGVPDSLLKNFCAYVTDHAEASSHIIAANEGNAVGLATGHTLATNNPAVVYLQNSGLGNIVNPTGWNRTSAAGAATSAALRANC